MSRGDMIVAEARSWIDTRWKHQASLKGVGADCIGLIGGVGVALNLPAAVAWSSDRRFHGYGRTPDPIVLAAACGEYLDPIELEAVEAGDILLLRYEPENQPRHFAIVSQRDPLYIVHAYAQARKVVENRIDAAWRARIVRAYRIKSI